MRLRRSLQLIAGISALCAGAPLYGQSSAARPDVVGVWRMDTTKFAKHDAELAALTLDVSRSGDTLVVATHVSDVGRPPAAFTNRYVSEAAATASFSTWWTASA